ncbi:Coronin-2B [Clydaea vesicula]|uniref:Coronin-2B n=1 Tax=Clydaea vesicula TaxID=447962 RepID=A0AAD5TXH8_9FUNG|nr:Coronin-2B [Clydaea vesicula]
MDQVKPILSKYKNVFTTTPTKALYTSIKIDQTATTKLKCNDTFFAVPAANSNSISIFPVKMNDLDPIKIENVTPLNLVHGKPISDFEFSPLEPSIIASCTRTDGLVRLWKVPYDLPFQPSTQCSQREVDAANIYLAAHEKRVELIKFHPSVGNILLTSAIDSTVRLWEIEMMQDRISLLCPNEGIVQSMSLDYNGDILAATANNAFLHLYDARAQKLPINSTFTQLNQSKALKVQWLTPDPLILVSGFKEKGIRELLLYDNRKFDSPIQTIVIENTGVGILQPIWDPALPLIYNVAKGEGIRVHELVSGELKSVGILKVEKQATAFDLLPKSVCITAKCEIARFLRLGTDNSVETTSIQVPRVNGDSILQEDLYPALAVVDSSADVNSWFNDNNSIEPIMIDFKTLVALKNNQKDNPFNSIKANLKSKSLLRRANSLTNKNSISPSSSSQNINILASTEPLGPVTTMTVFLDGYILIEKRGWFGSVWEKHYISLKKSRLYVSTDQDSDVPLFYISFSQIKKVEGHSIGKETTPGNKSNQVGFSIETNEQTWYFKAATFMERENWVQNLTKVITQKSTAEMVKKETQLVRPRSATTQSQPGLSHVSLSNLTVGNSNNASLFGLLGCLSNSFSNVKKSGGHVWLNKIVVLDEEGFIHIHPGDMKGFTQGKPPLESMNLSSVISVRLTDTTTNCENDENFMQETGMSIFQINSTKRVTFFQCKTAYEAANWVLEIRRVITARGIYPAAELVNNDVMEGVILDIATPQGPSLNSTLLGYPEGSKIWLSIIDGSFYYFQSNLSTSPSHVISSSQFEEVRLDSFDNEFQSDIKTDNKTSKISLSKSINSLRNVTYFDVLFSGLTIRHFVKSEEERGVWIKELSKSRMETFDLLGKVGINQDQILKEELARAKGEIFNDAGAKNIEFLDEKKVERGEQKCLIATVGKTKLIIALVESSWKSLKIDGSFVLDAGMEIYHWNGPNSSRMCQARAMGVASRIRKERGTKPKIFLIEKDDPELFIKFLSLLGLEATDPNFKNFVSNIPSSDQKHIEQIPAFRIFKVIQTQIRKRRLQLVYEGNLPSKSLLESSSVFILQCAPGEVFVWYGKESNADNRILATVIVRRLAYQMQEQGASNCVGATWITVQKVSEGCEYAVWKEKFIDYEGSLPISMRTIEKKGNIVREIQQIPIDIDRLLSKNDFVDTSCVDDGKSGTYKIYRVKDFTKDEVVGNLIGQFFRGESYIILYTYKPPQSGVEKCISYFWQGSESSITEKGTSALMTIEIAEQTKGDVVQVRVVEGKEPKHMCLLFKDSIITRLGVSTRENLDSVMAFDIREAFDSGVCKAVECEISELSFSSSSVLIIQTKTCSWIWEGEHSTEEEKKYATMILKRFNKNAAVNIVKEGEKLSEELNKILKVNGFNFNNLPNLKLKTAKYKPRLFSVSSGSGMVKVEEVLKFTVDDLDLNISMILDIGEKIYFWIGPSSKPSEKKIGMETVKKYLEKSLVHKKDTKLLVVYAYQETIDFIKNFQGWTAKRFLKEKKNSTPKETPLEEVLKEYTKVTYSVEVLLGDKLPENVDPKTKESYLSEDDFECIFGMKREDYLKIQPWKREEIRKKFGFF